MAGIPNTVLAHDFCHLPPLPNTDIAMPSLKRMHLTGSVEMSRHFILKNAATITLLDIPGQLPSHRDHDIVYDCLRELSCTRVGRNAASLCPALRHLKLEVGYGYDRLRQVVDEISELVHLKSLYFNYCRGGERMEREVETFFNLFDGQHELEEVSLSFGCRNWYHLTRLIDKLVKNNPSLKRLCLEDITMTNSCLQPLCALQHLERLVLGYQSEVTSAGIKALLRGGSRHVLQQLHFSYQTIMDEVREEVDRVNEEKKWMYLPLTASSRLVLQTRAQSYF